MLDRIVGSRGGCRAFRGLVPWVALLTLGGPAISGCGETDPAGSGATPPDMARFRVGAAVVSVDPTGPVYAGGMGLGPPVTRIHDPLSARAFYVSNGTKALAFAVVDSQGWFASCQEGEDLGLTGVRARAAAAISALGGPPLGQAEVMVQASHSHAAPTVQGVWGPVPAEYLELLGERTVEALTAAARNARPAHLEWGGADAAFLNNLNTAQYDSYPGWTADGRLTVLRAVDPADGGTIVTFVNVPTHPDIVCGVCLGLLSADFEGVVRRALEERLGGVGIVGTATIGRQETPVQGLGLEQMEWFGGVVTSLVFRALSGARQVTDATLAAVDSLSFAEATNLPLLILNLAWALPPDLRDVITEVTGKYPINRSVAPPYLDGTRGGTWLTAARIGKLLYLSMPGEPFPEITLPLALAVPDADAVISLSKAQDDLGYLYPAWVSPYTSLYESDHGDFNVSTEFGDVIVGQQLTNAAALGFSTLPLPSSHLPTDWSRGFKPGLQAMASPVQGSAGDSGALEVGLQAFYEPAAVAGRDLDGQVAWQFGDGSSTMTPPGTVFTRAFPPGRHEIRLRAKDTTGEVATWSLEVEVHPRLRAQATARAGEGRDVTFTGQATGGQGRVLAWRWAFSDGEFASGQTVTHRFPAGAELAASLTVTDGSGAVARASAEVQ